VQLREVANPVRSRRVPSASNVVLSGPDTLRVNALGELEISRVELFDALQQRAIAERDTRSQGRDRLTVVTPWRLAGQPLLMAPHGAGKGQWRWLMRCPAATLSIGLGHLNGICCQATLSSPFLWRFGYQQAWSKVERLLTSWCTRAGVTFQVSELHLCADVAGVDVDELRAGDFVHRGRIARWRLEDAEILELATSYVGAPDPSGRAGTSERPAVEVLSRYREQETLVFSQKAPHSATIYNKPREIRLKSRDKLWFADLWRRNGWNSADPIARVEIRYEREALHEFGCEHVEQTFGKMDALWGYSTREWLRHTLPNPADKMRSRWPVSPWWETVQGASFGKPQSAPAQRRRVRDFQEERMAAMVLGYLESWSAWRAGNESVSAELDVSTALRDIAGRADGHYLKRGSDFFQEVLKKRRQIGFAR
jgi:hypothetical protein